MTPRARVVVVVLLVVLAGCSFTLDSASDESPTPSEAPGVTEETPSVTPTPEDTSPYPPGVNETTLENVSALLIAHTTALNGTGYVANGSGNTTVRRSGFLVDVFRGLRVVVAGGSERYFEVRRTRAGPVDRLVQRYANGSREYRRHEENGDVTFRVREPQSAEKLAGVDYLDSFLRGGNFTVTDVDEEEDPAIVRLRANGTANETALLSGLPENAQRITSYEAVVVVDAAGRVRWMTATTGFVIGGEDKTHEISFNLTRTGVTNVSEPDWLDEARESEGDSDGASG